jgi:hypothetical protein
MAQTPAAVQAQLSTELLGPKILIADEGAGGTQQRWYVQGGTTYPGVTKWCVTTASQTAAQQATAIAASLLLGNGYP